MPKKIDLELYFLGERDYVNGLTLFEEMTKTFLNGFEEGILQPFSVRLFKVNRFVRNHATMHIYQKGDPQINDVMRDALAYIEITIASGAYVLLLFTNDNMETPVRRPNYDRGIYILKDEYSDSGDTHAELSNAGDAFELLRGVVEVNDRFLKADLRRSNLPQGVFWAYMTNFRTPDRIKRDDRFYADFRLKNISISNAGRYVLRTVDIRVNKLDFRSEICFFSRLAKT